MSITRVGSTSRNVELVNAAGAADNLPAESGWQAGDLDIIAVSWYENGAASITTPSGYTKLGADRLIGGSGPDESWASFYAKVLTAADGPSTIQFSGAVYANAVRLTLRPSSGKAFSGMPAITDGTAASATTDVVCPDVAGAAGQAQVAIAICENQHTLASAPADLDAGPAGVNTNANAVIICWRTLTGDIGAQTVVINSADGGVRGFSALVTEVSLADPVPLFRVGDTGTGSAVGGANGVGGTGAAGETTGATGTAAASNANDTASASGTTTVTGASARTAANDTSSASGTTTVAGTLARTNAGDTASASGSVGSPITGTVAATNAGDTSSAAGTTTVTGASARTAGNDSASAAGTTTVLGTAARTNADDTGSASGSVGGAVSGTAAVTAADDTAAASGTTAVTGAVSATAGNDTAAASGTTAVTGAVSATAGNDTATASGAAGAVSGSAAATGGDDTASAAGATAGGQQSGGWGQSSNRKPRDYTPTAEQIHAERVRLGILPAEEAPAAVAESAPVSSSAPAAAKPLAVPSLSRVEIDAAAIVAANEAIRAAIAAAQQEELSRLVWESVQQDEAAVVALIAELV